MKTTDKYAFWQKLVKAPLPLYLKYQALVARKYSGKWIRGFEIATNGTVNLILE